MAKKPKAKRYDIDEVRRLANGRWAMILSTLGGIDVDLLDGSHHACPKPGCGGKDRFRFTDLDGDGSVICNVCGKFGDGFAALEWITGQKFAAVLALVADHLGVDPIASTNGSHKRGKSAGSKSDSSNADPAEHLEFLPWNDLTCAYWCLFKPPITPAAVKACGGQIARYRKQHTVIALPIWGEGFVGKLSSADVNETLQWAKGLPGASPTPPPWIVGWCLYNQAGGPLPKYPKPGTGGEIEWVKVKLTHGSKPGWIGPVAQLAAAATVFKLEGPSDLLAFYSLPEIPAGTIALTNASGAKERPQTWMLESLAGKVVNVLHDADKPGQEGAEGWDEKGKRRPGWLQSVAGYAAETHHVKLPFDIEADHGKDLRDYLNDGGKLDALDRTAFTAEAKAAADEKITSNEAPEDPHRLARVNLEQYAAQEPGATIKFWRGEWFTWKPSRGCYKAIDKVELRAKIGATIKREFDHINIEETLLWKDKGEDVPPPVTRKVTDHLVTNVLAATATSTCVKFGVELMTWLKDSDSGEDDDGGVNERQNYIAMKNGILDLDRLLEDRPEDTIDDILLPHSPNWFSTVRLPYSFDPDAKCPKWEAFLEKNLELDPERIKLVQEWAGYLLLPDTSHQAFLAMEGEGANGKSVYCAAIAAMLGVSNCSYVSVDNLSDKFVRTQTLGRLVNICPDVSEIDKANEGDLKSFVAGDVMFFDRKFLSGLNCVPTARLMMSFNNRPRWSDRSHGIWRRMLLVPWQVEISKAERIRGMDKTGWWERSGELPGIFLWAVMGLHRLRQQGRFTETAVGAAALDEYQQETNPARSFLLNHFEISSNTAVRCEAAYEHYTRWIEANGYKPLGEALFGKEVRRVFKGVERRRGGSRADRYWYYAGLSFSVDEICGKKIEDGMMF